jgi:hypothetical protein
MYGSFVLVEKSGKTEKAERFFLGDEKGKDEAWLRDRLFNNPEIMPIEEIDSAFAPLVPLCKELRTSAGVIDAVFINGQGRLTIVESKLWRNPQARREVVAQALDYASALSKWSYAELQRRVSDAVGKQGNVPFELVRQHHKSRLREPDFVDLVGQALRDGRFLVLIAGEGIRENVQSLIEFLNRNPSQMLKLGLIEVALYRFGSGQLLVQPRVLAQTEIIGRQVVVINNEKIRVTPIRGEPQREERQEEGAKRDRWMPWWQPVLQMKFDDATQEAPSWVGTNNVVLKTPFSGIQIKAYAITSGSAIAVFVAGAHPKAVGRIEKYLRREKASLISELPKGTEIKIGDPWPIVVGTSDIESDDRRRAWIVRMLNEFVNALRPRLRKWYTEYER